MRLIYTGITAILVVCFLLFRKSIDIVREKLTGIEVVREGEEHVGSWASKNRTAFTILHLRRDGSLLFRKVLENHFDTLNIYGRYQIVGVAPGGSTDYYPRLLAIGNNNDTLFNWFFAYITPYDTKTEKQDRMVLSPNNLYDTAAVIFFRIKQ